MSAKGTENMKGSVSSSAKTERTAAGLMYKYPLLNVRVKEKQNINKLLVHTNPVLRGRLRATAAASRTDSMFETGGCVLLPELREKDGGQGGAVYGGHCNPEVLKNFFLSFFHAILFMDIII